MYFPSTNPYRLQVDVIKSNGTIEVQTQSMLKRRSTEPMPYWEAKKFIKTGLEIREAAPVVVGGLTDYFKT